MGEHIEALAAAEELLSAWPAVLLQPAVLLRRPAVPCPVPVGAQFSRAGVLREWAQDILWAARDAAAGGAVQRAAVCT